MKENHDLKNALILIYVFAGVIALIFIMKSPLFLNELAFQNQIKLSPAHISIDDDASIGNENANLVVVGFFDFQDVYSRKFYTETFPEIKRDYIDTGKVRFVFRDFPNSDSAELAAQAAECAREQGQDIAFFIIANAIVEKQNERDTGRFDQVNNKVEFTKQDLKLWAIERGYNIDNCLDTETYKNEVLADKQDAQQMGLTLTPSFFINQETIIGAEPYSVFKQAIDKELAKI